MKNLKIIISLIILFSISIVNAGGPIPKGCPLEGYEENEYCPSYYTIGKANTNVSNFILSEDEILKNEEYLLVEEGKYYILENNYFYDNGLKDIKESFFVGEGWINTGKINKGDVIIVDNNIYGYENNINFSKEDIIKSENFIKNKINFNGNLEIINTYGNYYKVTCENDIISLSNEGINYDLGFKHNKVFDEKIGNKETVRNNLQYYIKTCDNFNKLFDIKVNYKNNKNYSIKLEQYEKSIENKFGKIISKINGEKKIKLLKKIEILRTEKNNDINLIQEKKDNINILLDALIEVIKSFK